MLLGVGQQRLAEGEHALLGANTAALKHNEVLLDLPILREASHGVDGFVGQVILCGGIVLDQLAILHLVTLTHSVDLLVDLGSVMVSLLPRPGYSALYPAGMPGSNTSNLPQALVRLPGQLLGVPPTRHALEAMALGHSYYVYHLVLGRDSTHWNLLLKVIPGKLDLISNGATIQLNLHDVSFLLPPPQNLHLSVHDDPDHSAVLLDLLEIFLNLLLAQVISPLGAGLGEGLLLALGPVLVEPSLGLLANMLSPDSLEGPQTTRSLYVSNNPNSYHGWRLHDSDGLHNLFLVHLGARPVQLPHDVSHASLVAHEAGEVHGLAGVILGEGLHLATVPLGPLLGQEPLGAVAGSLELSMRHGVSCRSESSNNSL